MEWWQIKDLMITGALILGVLVPVLAITYRLLVRSAQKDRGLLGSGVDPAAEAIRDQRLDDIERQLEDLGASIRRLAEVTEFDRQLKAGTSSNGEGKAAG
jgi:hypothetical protein